MIRLYMDENVADAITDALRLRGADVLSVREDGLGGKPDGEVLDRATTLGRVVFTFDADFYDEASERIARGVHFAGVIYARQMSVTIGQCVRDLEIICLAGEPEDLVDRIDRLPLYGAARRPTAPPSRWSPSWRRRAWRSTSWA